MNLQKADPPCRPLDNLQERPDLRRQVRSKYQNYECNIEADEYDFQRLEKKGSKYFKVFHTNLQMKGRRHE